MRRGLKTGFNEMFRREDGSIDQNAFFRFVEELDGIAKRLSKVEEWGGLDSDPNSSVQTQPITIIGTPGTPAGSAVFDVREETKNVVLVMSTGGKAKDREVEIGSWVN